MRPKRWGRVNRSPWKTHSNHCLRGRTFKPELSSQGYTECTSFQPLPRKEFHPGSKSIKTHFLFVQGADQACVNRPYLRSIWETQQQGKKKVNLLFKALVVSKLK